MTKIEWASLGLGRGETWNPIRALAVDTFKPGWPAKIGWHCEKVSPACENCYAERQNVKPGASGGTGLPYKPGHRQNGDVEIYLDEKTLLAPLHWKTPRGIFVCSMTDIFADFVTDDMRDRIFAVAILSPHRYAFLTKRAARQRAYMSDERTPHRIARVLVDMMLAKQVVPDDNWPVKSIGDIDLPDDITLRVWPPKNTWHGVTAEDQPRADERIPNLLATPAAVRFVSIEPMLGAINLAEWIEHIDHCGNCGAENEGCVEDVCPRCHAENVLISTWGYAEAGRYRSGERYDPASIDGLADVDGTTPTLNLIITGGESGPHARGTPAAFFRSIRDQCTAAGVAYHHKQNGEWIDADELWRALRSEGAVLYHDGKVFEPNTPLNYQAAQRVAVAAMGTKAAFEHLSDGSTLIRVGKARAGRLLDGREHSEFPEAR